MTAPDSAVIGSIAPETPTEAATPVLPWHQRLQNRVRMAILNWLGVTPVLIELGRRNAGNRSDIETIAGNTQGMLTSLNACISATNRNTRAVSVMSEYPILHKMLAEDRARQAQAANKVISNGNGDVSQIVDISGKPLSPENN